MSFTRIMTIFLILYALTGGAFFFALFDLKIESTTWTACGLFVLATAFLFTGYLLVLRNRMAAILDKLSSTIQSLMNGQARAEFPVYEDNLLSKVQDQVLKLSGILYAQRQRYKEEGEAVKSLITDITHQLRTPLANLTMYNGLLADETLSPAKRSEFVRVLRDQTDKLSWLMDSLVKMSRLEAGVIEIRAEQKNLVDTALVAIKTAFPAAKEQGVEIAFAGRCAVSLPHDVKWTGEAIGNVLDNAIKYTQAGGKITVSVERYEMFARVDIRDTGRGIPEWELAKIFQRFYRGSSSSDTEGVGVGLYLARKIISEQGGYMKASSEVGHGSVFSLFLPVDPVHDGIGD